MSYKYRCMGTAVPCIMILVYGFVLAQEPQISLSSSIDKSRMTIGDLVNYTVEVAHDKAVRVEMPGVGANLGGFDIRDYKEKDPIKKNGMVISSVEYTISTFFTGEFEIPPLTVTYFTPGDSIGKSLSTEKIKIVVESMKPSESGDIRDIKPPVEIQGGWTRLIRWIVLGSAVLLISVLGFVLYRKKKGKGILSVLKKPPRPAHELAYDGLDRLKQSDLLIKGRIKQYYIEISEIIRLYIEGRYFLVAMELTTSEVLDELICAGVSQDELHLFRTFLNRCDMVKFAKVIPSAGENEDIINQAYTIVDQTKIFIDEGPVTEETGKEQDQDMVQYLKEEKQDAVETSSEVMDEPVTGSQSAGVKR